MRLDHTQKLMQTKLEQACFDSYAVLVYYNGERHFLSSDNVNPYTYFDIASMGKVLITSTLILNALSKGMLSLKDTLGHFFICNDAKQNITIQQLLTHTSGIIRYPIAPESVSQGQDAIAQNILTHPLAYAPGTNCIYSCNGYLLLGYILEKIYGMPLEKIYHTIIATPLNLQRTSFEINMNEENAAICYRWNNNQSKRFDDENVLTLGKAGGSGGQQSCLHDIEKFIMAVLQKNKLLYSEKWFDLAEQNYTATFHQGRGLGYLVVDEGYSQTGKLFPCGSFGHCGHTGQSFFINRDQNMFVIILTNATRFLNLKSNFTGYDYNDICRMREAIHNEIFSDIHPEKVKKKSLEHLCK